MKALFETEFSYLVSMAFVNKHIRFLICIIFFIQLQSNFVVAQIYTISTGTIKFKSEARLELIKAESGELKGKIDVAKKTFAFGVKMRSFEGFNSPLQKEHFNENYLETNQYPDAYFTGKIIEDINLTQDGTYQVRAKGNLIVHGIAQERIIKSTLTVRNGVLLIDTDFTVQLSDHNIPIPKIVHENLASEISVSVHARLQQ